MITTNTTIYDQAFHIDGIFQCLFWLLSFLSFRFIYYTDDLSWLNELSNRNSKHSTRNSGYIIMGQHKSKKTATNKNNKQENTSGHNKKNKSGLESSSQIEVLATFQSET